MPTTWIRTPEEFHKIYAANTNAFYCTGYSSTEKELDDFMTRCALNLWSRRNSITRNYVGMANQIYSNNQPKPSWTYWKLKFAVRKAGVFLPPSFFWNLAENDANQDKEASRIFIRMMTNILLYLATVDGNVTYEEAAYIAECAENLCTICDSAGVRKSKSPLDPMSFVTVAVNDNNERQKAEAQIKDTETVFNEEREKECNNTSSVLPGVKHYTSKDIPFTWILKPEEFHKSYTAATEVFESLGDSSLIKKIDEFVTDCALNLWSRGGNVTQSYVDMANQIYSRNQTKPDWSLWSLKRSIKKERFCAPSFFYTLANSDAYQGKQTSRALIQVLDTILIYLAAVDDDVSYDEAAFITDCSEKLNAICDSAGVRRSEEHILP